MPDSDEKLEFGCIFCRTGSELHVAEDIENSHPGICAFAPRRLRKRHMVCGNLQEAVILFPGYVFIAAPADYPAARLMENRHCYRLLHAEGGGWQLRGADRDLARMMYENHGIVGISQAYYEGGRIRIADGFLRGREGEIIRVNRRAQTAQVRLRILDRTLLAWVGFELLGNMDGR